MQKQQKIIAVAGMLAIIAGIGIATTMEEVQAQLKNPTHPDVQRLSPGSYGAKTAGIVCGDRLCVEAESIIDIEEDTPIGTIGHDDANAPTVRLISIDKYSSSPGSEYYGILYKITFSLMAGDTNLRDIQIHVQSDVDNYEFSISSLNALSSSTNVLRVHAMDSDSITGEIVGYSLTGPTGGPPR